MMAMRHKTTKKVGGGNITPLQLRKHFGHEKEPPQLLRVVKSLIVQWPRFFYSHVLVVVLSKKRGRNEGKQEMKLSVLSPESSYF